MRYISLLLAVSLACGAAPGIFQKKQQTSWKRNFDVDKTDLTASGRNEHFILEPRYQLTLAAGAEKLVITVLDETKLVDGVETRVVEERETRNDQLVEVSRNYFAISQSSKDIYYFGEDVDIYKDGTVASHEGSWLAGLAGARFGLAMPGQAQPGAMYYQEFAPRSAMDRARIVSTTETLVTPAGTFNKCLKVEETTPLEPATKEYKYYAAGIGLIRDGSLKLTRYGKLP
jgi:hypothetical protein